MTTPSAKFAVELQDETSGAANAAANSLQNLQAKISEDTKALSQMKRAMRQLKGGTFTNVAAFRELRDKIDAQKASIAQAQAKYVELGGTFERMPRSVQSASGSLDRLGTSAGTVPGPLGRMVQQVGALKAMTLGGVIAGGVAAIAIALAALAAAAAVATAALLKYGLGHANARRQELLHLEGLTTIRRWYGLAGGSAEEMQKSIDRVSSSVRLGRGELGQYTEQLHRMGLRGEDLDAALEGMAITASVQGEAQARRFAGWAASAARAGGSVRALADDVQSRLGGIAARQMLDLDVQMAKLKENFSSLFDGLRIEGFLQKFNELTALFSQSTATGRALKALAERMLQPLIDAFEWLAPMGRRFFQGMVIGALLVEQGILRLRLWLKKTFGDSEILDGIDGMSVALWLGVAVVGALVGGLVALAVVLGLVAVFAFTFALPFLIAAAAIAALVYGAIELVDFFRTADWAELGRSLVDGLVSGITSGGRAVRDAVQGLAGEAKDALTSALGIRSPSRVFAELGVQIPRGLAEGVDTGAPIAAASVQDVIDPPALGAGDAGAGGSSVSIGELHIHTDSSEPRELAKALRDELARILEGVSIEMGAT